jgi:hypothetical protein
MRHLAENTISRGQPPTFQELAAGFLGSRPAGPWDASDSLRSERVASCTRWCTDDSWFAGLADHRYLADRGSPRLDRNRPAGYRGGRRARAGPLSSLTVTMASKKSRDTLELT